MDTPESGPGSTTVVVAPSGEGIGEVCVRMGWTTPERVQECLRAQAELLRRGDAVPRLGELLVSRGFLSSERVAQALALLGQKILHCPACAIQVNAPRRRRAAGYMCPRCHRPLVVVAAPGSVAVEDDSPIVVSPEPLPADVLRAARDPRRRLGKYLLLRELGRGGSGQVYLAWDTFLCQKVALKLLRSDVERGSREDAATRVQGLVAEARHAVRLRHPGIVAVYEAGRIGQDFYVSMEYVEGRALDTDFSLCAGRGEVSAWTENPRGILGILAGVARALHHAHTRPVPLVHCDLKPGNVIVDAEGQPRVLDFGLARVLGAPAENGIISGTPGYMSPEQASGANSEIDPRSDVYALGAVLYHALCGRAPFEGESVEVLSRTLREDPVSPSQVLATTLICGDDGPPHAPPQRIPPYLEDLCLRCLSKKKELRPASMLEVADLLQRASRPPAALSVSPTRVPDAADRQRARRRPRLRRAFLAAAAVPLAALAALFAGPRSAPAGGAVGEADVAARLASFQPDRAAALARALGSEALLDEALRLEALRSAILSRLPLDLPGLHLREESLGEVRLLGGDAGGLRIRAGARERPVAWSDLEPSQVLALARAAGAAEEPGSRKALALYCLRVGRRSDAREFQAP